jgi:hypothetical protein
MRWPQIVFTIGLIHFTLRSIDAEPLVIDQIISSNHECADFH